MEMFINQKRILLVDDNKAIHDDFYKVLKSPQEDEKLLAVEAILYGKQEQQDTKKLLYTGDYIIDSAYQGQEALELVKEASASKKNYALAFIDVRMPPGWDGVETAKNIWDVDSNIPIVICSAYSDYSWKNIAKKLKFSDNFLVLKKPFDVVEIRQLAASL